MFSCYSSDQRVLARAVVGEKLRVRSVPAFGDGEHTVSGGTDEGVRGARMFVLKK